MRESLLRAQPRLDRPLLGRPVGEPPRPVLDLEQRPKAALDRAVATIDGERRASWPQPSGQSASTSGKPGRPPSRPWPPSRSGPASAGRPLTAPRTGSCVRPRSRSGPFAVAPCRRTPSRPDWSSSRRRTAWRRSAGSRVHVGLVVVADGHEAVAPLERSGQRLQADVVGAPSPAKATMVRSSSWGSRLGGGEPGRRPRRRSRRRPRSRRPGVEPGDVPGGGREPCGCDLEAAGRADDHLRALDRVEHRAARPSGCRIPGKGSVLREVAGRQLRAGRASSGVTCLPLGPTYFDASPAKTELRSAGWRSRPPRPYTWLWTRPTRKRRTSTASGGAPPGESARSTPRSLSTSTSASATAAAGNGR